MHLLIDASRANNEQKTGVEWYAFFVIEELKKMIPPDWRVTLYAREKLRGDLAKLPPNWQEKILSWPPRRLWTQIRISFEMLKFRYRADAILFVPAHVLPLVCPPKTMITIHDLGGARFRQGYSFFERFYTYFATWWALKKGIVLVPSNFARRELEHVFKNPSAKIKVISNAYDASSFKIIDDSQKQSAAKKYNLTRPYFFSIGRLEEKKNTVGIIRAFSIFRKSAPEQYQLLLLGKPGFGFDRVQKEIDASPFKKDIVIPGWVEQKDVPDLMAGAMAMLFPSFYEGFGIPILEAFGAGTPVITSSIASMPEVAGGAALLVNPNKPQEIALAMRAIIEEKESREELIKKGLERAEEFNWKKTAAAIFKVAEELGK